MAKYKVIKGLNYMVKGQEVRREPGEVVDDIPTKSVDWLLEPDVDGVPCIERVGGDK